METIYRKVEVSERKPKIDQKVIGIGDNGDTSTMSVAENGYWYSYEWQSECDEPEYWLEEIPSVLEDENKELREMLEKSKTAFDKMINPVKHFEASLKEGERLNGYMIMHITDKPRYYIDIASKLVSEIEELLNK